MDHWEAVKEEMIKGQESAMELKASLQLTASPEQAALLENVLRSFSKLRSLSSESVRQYQLIQEGSGEQDCLVAIAGSPGSETSSERKRTNSSGDRRGSHRKRRHPYLWTRVTNEKYDDGHSWRKYGQKEIQSNKYPRSYFRCTHKTTQGCPAMKQVQKADDDDSTYIITYLGEHNCRELPKVSQFIIENSPPTESNLISFASEPINSSNNIGKDKEKLHQVHAAYSWPPLGQFKTSNNFMQFIGEELFVQDLTPTCSSSSECFTVGSGNNNPTTGFDSSPQVLQIGNYVDDHAAAAAAVGSCSGEDSYAFDMSYIAASVPPSDDMFDFEF